MTRAGQNFSPHEFKLIAADQLSLAVLGEALDLAASLAPEAKERAINACAHVIGADYKVTASEAELFRAIADALGCPVPPLLPGQPLV